MHAASRFPRRYARTPREGALLNARKAIDTDRCALTSAAGGSAKVSQLCHSHTVADRGAAPCLPVRFLRTARAR